MKLKSIFFILFSIAFLSFSVDSSIKKKVRKVIEKTYGIENFSIEGVIVPNENSKELAVEFSENNLMKIQIKDSLIGYAYAGKAPSKTDEFDYLVLFDSDLIVVKTKILAYREDYGGEIGSKRWLKQFIGSTKDSSYTPNDNIVTISGATISVNSMTNAMNKVLKSIGKLQELNIL